ncbi:MAG: hypothetical protein LQ348_001955 [Seirophora lacunosa]|nr:MAG: hypothetical protein LQ348_001955 [Seirophora lacunosa]
MLPFANRPNAATRDRAWNNTGNLRAPAEVSQVIEHPDYFYSQLLDPMDDIQAYRTRWIELPGDVFNGSSIGAAILLPRSEQDPVQEVVLCNIAAGWGRSSLVASSNSKVSGGGMISTFQEGQNLKAVTLPISRGINPEAQPTTDQFGNAFHYLDFPRRLINISASWAQYIDPLIQGRNTSLLDMLIQEAKIQGEQPTSIPETIVMLFVNGLARTAWGSTLQGEVKSIEPNGEGDLDGNYWIKGKGDVIDVDPTESQDWVTFRVDSTLDGYAYNVMTTPPKIAIAILTAYVLLVVGHTLYSGITGISSNCWDTIAEVTALAVNSTPTAALRNTCAGISEFHIFKLPVRILVSKDEEGEGEHLELVFGRTDEEKVQERTIKANRTYGTLPRGCDAEGKKEV